MKRKILTITYTCPEDKVNLGEADIMGTILQKLGELGAYDINLKASSAEVREPAAPKVRETGPQIPAFLQERRSRPSRRGRGPRGPCGLKYNMLYIHMLFLSTTAGYVVYFSWPIS